MDAGAFVAYANESLGGMSGVDNKLSAGPAEQNAFLGWPLCLFAVVFTVAFRRIIAVRLAAAVGGMLAVLSLGEYLKVNGIDTGIPAPWGLVSRLPLFDSIIVTRLALGVSAAIGVIVAVAADRVVATMRQTPPRLRRPLTALAVGALAVAFVPIAPTPLPTSAEPPIPAFFSNGAWQRYVGDGTIMPVPPDTWTNDAMNWLVASRMRIRVADGYFLGPTSQTNPVATFGGPQSGIGFLLRDVAGSGRVPPITDQIRAQMRADLAFYQVDALVLGPRGHRDALRSAVDQILDRPGVEVDGVWVWDVRDLR
jgi:hypothetical protein